MSVCSRACSEWTSRVAIDARLVAVHHCHPKCPGRTAMSWCMSRPPAGWTITAGGVMRAAVLKVLATHEAVTIGVLPRTKRKVGAEREGRRVGSRREMPTTLAGSNAFLCTTLPVPYARQFHRASLATCRKLTGSYVRLRCASPRPELTHFRGRNRSSWPWRVIDWVEGIRDRQRGRV